MPAESDKSKDEEVARTVRNTLLQLADLRDLEDRAVEISERLSKLTPPPETSESEQHRNPSS
jgi:hypothetical protein